MPDQQAVDAEWADRDLKQRVEMLEAFVGGLREAGLDRLIESGLIQFDGTPIRMDPNGIQVNVESGTQIPAFVFVEGMKTDPTSSTINPHLSALRGQIYELTGYLSNIGLAAYHFDTDNYADVTVVANNSQGNDSASVLMNAQAGAPASTTAQAFLFKESGRALGEFGINNAVLRLYEFSADNTAPNNGDIWHYTDIFYGRLNGATKAFLMEGDVSGAMKVSGSGYLVYPSAAAGIDPANSGSAWTSGNYSEVVASTAQANYIVGMMWSEEAGTYEYEIDIATGAAASETVVSTIPGATLAGASGGDGKTIMFPHAIAVATTTRIAVRVRSSSTTEEPDNIKLIYVKQSELVAL